MSKIPELNLTTQHYSVNENAETDKVALAMARQVISSMVQYGYITTQPGNPSGAYYVGENVIPIIMGKFLK